MNSVQSAKSHVRDAIRTIISLKSKKDLQQAGLFAAERFACWYEQLSSPITSAALFRSMKDELCTEALFSFLVEHDVLCYFPEPKQIMAGFRSPKGDYSEPGNLDLIIIPGRAFDASGHRLGRGMGYYDRLLAPLLALKKRPLFMGMALTEQVIAYVPHEPHDIVMDFLCTPDGLYLSQS